MIGASVVICVENLARRAYESITVEKVQTLFIDRDYDSPEEIVAFGRKYFWQGVEAEAEKIFWELYNSGRVRQPQDLKYGRKLVSWPCPGWFYNYQDYRARQMRHGNERFIELLEKENLHADLA